MFWLTSKQDSKLLRGAYTAAVRLQELYPEHCKAVYASIEDVEGQYVHFTQVPANYGGALNITQAIRRRDKFYLRPEVKLQVYKMTNGFSVSKLFKIPFVPVVTDFRVKTTWPVDPVVGFYNAPHNRPDSSKYYRKMIAEHSDTVFYCLGTPIDQVTPQTYNAEDFFKAISHFVYYPTTSFIDPWPTTLAEAVQNNIQIIVPDVKRNFKDGIDDIVSVTKVFKEFKPDWWDHKRLDNFNCALNFKYWDKYYKYLFENNWTFPQHKVKNFAEWCSKVL